MNGWREEVANLPSNQVWLPAGFTTYDKRNLAVLANYEVTKWLNENCHGSWHVGFVRVIAYIDFADPRDLVLFKLFWSDRMAK